MAVRRFETGDFTILLHPFVTVFLKLKAMRQGYCSGHHVTELATVRGCRHAGEIMMFNAKRLAQSDDNIFTGFPRNRSGATAIEYALIAGIISIGIVAGAGTLGTAVKATYDGFATTVSNVTK